MYLVQLFRGDSTEPHTFTTMNDAFAYAREMSKLDTITKARIYEGDNGTWFYSCTLKDGHYTRLERLELNGEPS